MTKDTHIQFRTRSSLKQEAEQLAAELRIPLSQLAEGGILYMLRNPDLARIWLTEQMPRQDGRRRS